MQQQLPTTENQQQPTDLPLFSLLINGNEALAVVNERKLVLKLPIKSLLYITINK